MGTPLRNILRNCMCSGECRTRTVQLHCCKACPAAHVQTAKRTLSVHSWQQWCAAEVQAQIWQLRFHAAPTTLKDVNHDLATNEDVLRHQVTRSRDRPKIKQWRVAHHYTRLADFDAMDASAPQQPSA